MTISTGFIRVLFVVLSLIFMLAFSASLHPSPTLLDYTWGTLLGLTIGGVLVGLDFIFKRFNLRTLNTTILGLFIGYLMALALTLIFKAIVEMSGIPPEQPGIGIAKIFIFLFGTYLGVTMTLRASDEIYFSIPFVKCTPTSQKSKEILLDISALSDPRMIDLAASGLLNKRVVLPRILLKELHKLEESHDEMERVRARRALEVAKKLETLPDLNLRYQDTDFPEVKDVTTKVLRLARLVDADVLSADINRVQMAQIEGVRVINIHALSNALKPLMQKGECLKIKIQRYGKEDLQGVGYLEDGTMVVVNGGGDYIGETITSRVLSVKHTTSGRMIFCNVAEEGVYEAQELY